MTTGGTEILVVLAIAVLLFGPKKLPELARTIGQAMGEYHRASREFENEMRKTTTAVDKEISTATRLEPKSPIQKAPQAKPSSATPRPIPPRKPTSPTTTSKPPSLAQSHKVKEIAQNLEIPTENKSDAQLLKEISSKTKMK
jgi:TatA/E family protein of Tat protein translocase